MHDLIAVRQLPIIEEHLKALSVDIEARVKDALSLAVTEDTVKQVKVVRAELNKQFKELEKTYSNFTLFDENKMGDHDYTDNEAVDSDHLCGNAVPKITSRLDSVLKTLK